MASLRKEAKKKLLENADDETKILYTVAECICRKEDEKLFHYNLDLPFGHPQNMIYFSSSEERNKILMNEITFWEALKEKYFEKCNDPLASAIDYFCDVHATGALKLMTEPMELYI